MHHCCGSNDFVFLGFDGGTVNIAQLDETVAEGIMKEKILTTIDEQSHCLNCITQRGGEWGNVSVSSAFMFLPTNGPIYGVPSGQVPKWN